MDRHDFCYELPDELIAQAPLSERGASRLLVLDGASGALADRHFADLERELDPGDLLVLNDTRVLPARARGRKASGGRVELLLERIVAARVARVQIKASRSPQPGAELRLAGGASARVVGRDGRLFEIELDCDCLPYFEAHGEVPLPPYIARPADDADRERYQTVFARRAGAVAAPTAGLHFDTPTLAALERRGVEHAFLTLHVGAGTFAPVRVERVEDHELHAEWLEVDARLCERIEAARARGARVVAVGTTSVRALETAAREGTLAPFRGESQLFIYPGYRFRVVDAMITNFHLPESSLLMLVAAFAGHAHVMRAYRHAVAERYRFFSYGDAMFVTRAPQDEGDDAL
jgi:S-adenosylmethionine:tRNA ribosyltransferase-isomerase